MDAESAAAALLEEAWAQGCPDAALHMAAAAAAPCPAVAAAAAVLGYGAGPGREEPARSALPAGDATEGGWDRGVGCCGEAGCVRWLVAAAAELGLCPEADFALALALASPSLSPAPHPAGPPPPAEGPPECPPLGQPAAPAACWKPAGPPPPGGADPAAASGAGDGQPKTDAAAARQVLAWRHCRRAAREGGLGAAQVQVAVWTGMGFGTAADNVTAGRWAFRAADGGQGVGAAELAVLTAQGLLVEPGRPGPLRMDEARWLAERLREWRLAFERRRRSQADSGDRNYLPSILLRPLGPATPPQSPNLHISRQSRVLERTRVRPG